MNLVRNYMMRRLDSVCYTDTISYVVELMNKAEMAVLPVVDEENTFLGTIYGKNILKNLIPEQFSMIKTHRALYKVNIAAENMIEIKDRKVKDYMSRNTEVVKQTDSMDNVADIMLNNGEQYLFVVNDNNKLRGFISRAGLLFYLLQVAKGENG